MYNHTTVKEGDEFKPDCTVEGYPPPEITWWKEDESVDFPRRMERADDGEYTLTAIQNGLADNHTLEIVVLCK